MSSRVAAMGKTFTAILERDGDWYIAQCPEVPEANGQGRTEQEARASLAAAIDLVLLDRREDARRNRVSQGGRRARR